MKSIHTNTSLRSALHLLYVAQFETLKKYPDVFTKADATRMLTGLMGARPWSWRVVGITSEALEIFATNNFKQITGQVQRGHYNDRASTAQLLFLDRSIPMPIEEFFDVFLTRDQTVLMTKEQNKHRPGGAFPDFIPIDQDAEVFPSGTLVGWRHRKAEVEYLKKLHKATFLET
jgi:hypothetical protein